LYGTPIFMSMPNVAPRVSRSGPPGWTARTLPVPSMSGCFEGSVSSAKIRRGLAPMTFAADTCIPFILQP
jgi:hypothetical protein